jgi:hypothetical protein
MATKSKHRKNHKEKLAKRNTRIANEKKIQNKRMQEYVKQLMAEQTNEKLTSVAETTDLSFTTDTENPTDETNI